MNKFQAIQALRGYTSTEAESLKQDLFCSTEWFTPMYPNQQALFDAITGRLF